MNFLKWLAARFAEPSTHASLAAISSVASVIFPQYAPVLQGLTIAFGGAGIALPGAPPAAAPVTAAAMAAWMPPVHIAANPALAHAINVGLQAAITDLLTPPAK